MKKFNLLGQNEKLTRNVEARIDNKQENNLLAISDVDTRALVSYIRDNGAMNAR